MTASAPDESAGAPGRPSDDTTLPGEDPRSADPEDARHWITVYRELLRGVLLMRRAAGSGADARFRPAAEIYARRLLYWRKRRR